MPTKSFLESPEYQQFKEILNDNIILKAVDIKTDGKSNEEIARDITAHSLAVKLLLNAVRKFERQGLKEIKQQSWK